MRECETQFVTKVTYKKMRDPVFNKRNIREDARHNCCQKGTYERMRDPVFNKRNICENARHNCCQKGTYERMRDSIFTKKEHMRQCETQFLPKKEHMRECETQFVTKRNICDDARPSWCQKGTCVQDHPFSSTSFYPHLSFHLRPL